MDQAAVDLQSVEVDLDVPIREAAAIDGLLDLPTVLVSARTRTVSEELWPFREELPETESEPFDLVLIPYFVWANRGVSTMRVWLPQA